MSRRSWPTATGTAGFTLIEVIGALVIFSLGVLMVIQVSDALGVQMRYAGVRSQLVVLANERLDSLESEPVGSVTTGTTQYDVTVDGIEYECTVTVTQVTPALARFEVSLAAADGEGPGHSVTSYNSTAW